MTSKKKVLFVFGTRPEAIKLAPVIKEMEKHTDKFAPVLIATGQHREMLDQALKPFNIKPKYDLKIMEEGQSIPQVVSKTLLGLEKLIPKERPDMILVQGDTSTAFAASLSAYYHRIPLAHVEAGLRTRDKYRPFPEELNRKLTGVITDIHFSPTKSSLQNLIFEGVDKKSIHLTGNTVIDALYMITKRQFDLKKAGLDPAKENGKMILVTIHRRENFGPPLKNICEALKHLAASHPEELSIVLPVHKNPTVSSAINNALSRISNIQLIKPLEYEPFVHLMKRSYLILTDSGGIQEEAPSLGKPVLVLREITERPEAVECGAVKVVGMDKENIVKEAEKLLYDKEEYEKMAKAVNPYGDGKASERIVGVLLNYFGFTDMLPEEFSADKARLEKVA